MNLYQLSLTSQFIDPAWLRSRFKDRVRIEDNGLTLGGQRLLIKGLRIKPANLLEAMQGAQLKQESLPDGTVVEAWCDANGFYVCALAEEYDREQAERAARQAAKDLEYANRLKAREEQALAFNATLAVPVKWSPGIKDVLSGLSENSWGDGMNKRTVHHVLLEEPIREGKFKRNAGDFLCTAPSGTNGRNWAAQPATGAGCQVTCKACLKLAARWNAGAR